MMNLQLLNKVVCRTPQYSPIDKLEEVWSEFQEILAESSPEFHSQFKASKVIGLSKINNKIDFTLWKYANRSVFRSTPFGRFASFTCLPVTEEKTETVINKKMMVKSFTDWSVVDTLASKSTQISKCDWLTANSSLYTIGCEHRYLSLTDGNFEISSVNGFKELNAVLAFCKTKTAKSDVRSFLLKKHNVQYCDTDDLLEQMLKLQILQSNLCPNIIGHDYFQRLSQIAIPTEKQYLVSERKHISGGFNKQLLQDVPELILFLSKYLPTQSNSNIDAFKKAFLNKFEQQMVPITLVMDIELGVGYGDLGQGSHKNELIENIKFDNNQNDILENTIPYTSFTRFILDGLISNKEIDLDKFKAQSEAGNLLPNTFSVLFSIFGSRPVIGTIGNSSANALLGRFSIASSEIEKFGIEIANIETEANPDVIFFDVAYQAERHVDNVNRRKKLYQYEVPILSWTLNEEPIHLDDILVGVRGGDIILWSTKHDKRMIPRVPSAYNYHRSDLAVFRFFCDLQHYRLKTDLNLHVQTLFPSLSYYPRITYKSVIVSPARWKVPESIFENSKANNVTAHLNLVEWLDAKGIHNHFKAGEQDQLLCFDPKRQTDLEAFLLFGAQNKQKELYIFEALIDKTSVVKDEHDKPLIAEYIAAYAHKETIYHHYQPAGIIDNEIRLPVRSNFPLNDWLYFEIYCHPIRSNEMMCGEIADFLRKYRKNIKLWFFIKYEIPSHHIRLRIFLKDNKIGNEMIKDFSFTMESARSSGWVSEIQIKTYFPEVNRYGSERIVLVEKLFFLDSKYILSLLSKNNPEKKLYATALDMMSNIIAVCIANLEKQLLFTQEMATYFASEFSIKMKNFKIVNSSYKEFQQYLNDTKYLHVNINKSYMKTLCKVLEKCNSENERCKLASDLIHMHINRLFRTDQRIHEAILYQYFLTAMKTRCALS